jgi:hypothetical protein
MGRAFISGFPLLFFLASQAAWAQVPQDAAFMKFRAAAMVTEKVTEAKKKGVLLQLMADASAAHSLHGSVANGALEVDVENLFGVEGLVRPKSSPDKGNKDLLLIVGDNIDLSGMAFSTAATGAADLTIIANTLNVGDGNTRFDMQGRVDGGTLTLVALQGLIGRGGLTVSANGKAGPDRSQECRAPAVTDTSYDVTVTAPATPGGNGGKVRLFAAGQSPQIAFSAAAGQPGSGCSGRFIETVTNTTTCQPGPPIVTFPLKITIKNVCTTATAHNSNATLNTSIAAPGRTGASTTIGALVDLTDFVPIEHLWQWNFGMLQALEKNVHDAVRRNDQRAIVENFQRYKNLPALPIPSDKITPQSEILERMNTLRTTVVPPLWFNEIVIQPPGLPNQRQLVLTDGKNVLNRMAPTSALLQPLSTNGQQRWGILQIDPANAEKSTIVLSAKLSVDPYIESLVKAELAKNTQNLDGMFSGWTLNAKLDPIVGLDAVLSHVTISGDTLEASIVVNNASSNLFLWRLGTSPGIHLTVSWEYVDDTGRKATGPSFPLFLSLNKRGSALVIDSTARTMTNRGGSPLLLNYLVRSDQSILLLSPPVRVDAGASQPVPTTVADATKISVPAEAVEYLEAPSSIYDLFEVNADVSILKTVVVTNLLPAFDDELREGLRYLEVYVETWDTASKKEKLLRGPFRLSSAGTVGADVKFDLLKFPGRTMVTRLYGNAYYDQGSVRAIKAFESSDLMLHVGRAQF